MAESPPELQLELEKLERKHAENPEGRYFVPLANAYRKSGQLEVAERLLREGLRRHPDYLSAHIVLGRCLADREANLEAAGEFRYVLSLDPQNLIALRTLGELAAAEGKPEEAERWFRELLDIDPMNEEARRALDALEPPSPLAEPEDFEEVASWWEPTASAPDEAAPAPEPEPRPPPAPEPTVNPHPAVPVHEPSHEVEMENPEEEEHDVLESAELVTETIAELFARQGFHARAAEVYRELIRRRGPEPALQRRLAEIERLATGAAPEVDREVEVEDEAEVEAEVEAEAGVDQRAPLPPEPTLEPEQEADLEPTPLDWGGFEDAFAASFTDGFDLLDSATAPPPAPAPAWSPEADEAEELPPLETLPYFQDTVEPAPPAATPGPTIAALLAEIAAWRPADQAPEPAPVSGWAPVEAAPAPAEEEPAPRGTSPASDDLFPWELPAETVAAAPSAAPFEPAPAEAAADAGLSLEELIGAPELPAERPSAPPPSPSPAPAAEDDDDLESFQAWLRSLKR